MPVNVLSNTSLLTTSISLTLDEIQSIINEFQSFSKYNIHGVPSAGSEILTLSKSLKITICSNTLTTSGEHTGN